MNPASLCVAHLARAANGVAPLRAFLESYRRYPAGIEHELLILFKGFAQPLAAEYEALLKDVNCTRRFIADRGFDIDAYFETARAHQAKYYCFMNSFSVILADGWLEKMHRVLTENDAGMVGATGSWQSFLYASFLDEVPLPPSWLASYPGWKRMLLRSFPFLRPPWRSLRRWMLRGRFEPFPNYHLRTNAFLIGRELALRIQFNSMRKKFDAYEFESGSRGLTRQVLKLDKRVFVVGRDGKAYDMEHWHQSNTFWRRNQENLLVADNQTRMYDRSDAASRTVYSAYAWGPEADPRP